jgi:CheY-like chemotaxis protein
MNSLREAAGMPVPSTKSVVLVVEDEYLIRMDAVEVLERVGFHVIEAINADHAIALLEANSDVALIVTDIQMPGSIDGLRLAAVVKDRWPPIEIIVTSGRVAPVDNDLPHGARFLPKPYTDRALILSVRQLLGI